MVESTYAAQAPIQEAFTKFALHIIVLPLSLALRIIHTGSTIRIRHIYVKIHLDQSL